MADIFLSYASEDRERAETLAAGLESLGWSVFWDRSIPSGRSWRAVIADELEGARAVVVAWSEAANESTFVHEEADDGKDRGVLLPVRLDDVSPPIGFRSFQTLDLSGWNGDFEGEELAKLDRDLRSLIGALDEKGEATAVPPPEAVKRSPKPRGAGARARLLPWSLRLAGALAGLLVGFFLGGTLGQTLIGGEARSFAYLIATGMVIGSVAGFWVTSRWVERRSR